MLAYDVDLHTLRSPIMLLDTGVDEVVEFGYDKNIRSLDHDHLPRPDYRGHAHGHAEHPDLVGRLMRRLYALMFLSAMVLGAAAGAAIALALLPPCAQEDSSNCRWNASTQGNGEGKSFVDIAGTAYYLP